jgi:hypothetical protein
VADARIRLHLLISSQSRRPSPNAYGSHHRPRSYSGDRHGILSLPSNGRKAEERSQSELTKTELWKCRAMESLENQDQVFHPSHRPWKSLRDSHIPTASTTASYI